MPDNDRNIDPINPEQKAIQDAMKRDGEFLRDVREGKTPTEQAFGIDLGIGVPAEHDALMADMGEVVAQEAERTATPEPDVSPLELSEPAIPEAPSIEAPDVSEPPVGPVAQLHAEHADLMADLGKITAPERKKAERREEMARRRVEHRMRSEHNQAFVELGQVPHPEAPPEPDAPLGPAALARVAHPGREKPHDFGEAVAEFAHEDKQWRETAVEAFKSLANHVHQNRLDLERILAMLERIR